MRYRLSNRQLKELRNGKRLQIAVPMDHLASLESDPVLDQLRRLLELPEGCRVEECYPSLIVVSPLSRKGGGLGSVLGRIIRDDEDLPPWHILVDSIVAALVMRRPRGTYPLQWPGSVELDDGTIVPEVDGERQ